MALWQISQITSALKKDLVSIRSSLKSEVGEVVIDSRKKTMSGLFVAIIGENNDGHNFLSQAFENGCTASIVDRIPSGFEDDPRLILVKNSLQALNNLAIAARNRFAGKIIAITGSVGKTSIKEMLKTVFTTQGKTFGTSGNLNNHFGLPLSLCNLPADYDYGIFEMGMNHLGEIEPLSLMAKPDLVVVSNIASAHIGNFNNEEEIASAKAEIFSGLIKDGYAIINNDNKYAEFLKTRAIGYGVETKHIISFGFKETSNVRLVAIQNVDIGKSKIVVTIQDHKEQINYIINSINEATIFNSLIVVAILKLIGRNFMDGLNALLNIEPPKGRGNIIQINKNGLNLVIIDDSYNANLASMKAGLKFLSNLKNFKPNSRTIAVMGDMLELGSRAIEDHRTIAKYISEYQIDKVILVGELMKELIDELPQTKIIGHFQNSTLLSEQILSLLQDNDIIFVKGSRGTKMEKIVEKLILLK